MGYIQMNADAVAEFVILLMKIGVQEDCFVEAVYTWEKGLCTGRYEITQGLTAPLKITFLNYPNKVEYQAVAEYSFVIDEGVYDVNDLTPYEKAVELVRPYLQEKGENEF